VRLGGELGIVHVPDSPKRSLWRPKGGVCASPADNICLIGVATGFPMPARVKITQWFGTAGCGWCRTEAGVLRAQPYCRISQAVAQLTTVTVGAALGRCAPASKIDRLPSCCCMPALLLCFCQRPLITAVPCTWRFWTWLPAAREDHGDSQTADLHPCGASSAARPDHRWQSYCCGTGRTKLAPDIPMLVTRCLDVCRSSTRSRLEEDMLPRKDFPRDCMSSDATHPCMVHGSVPPVSSR
jgi:hypothetical protein